MSWPVVLFGLCGGALATYLLARLKNHHQTKKEPPPAAPPPKIEVDVFIRPANFFSSSTLGLGPCLCDECQAAELEFAAIKEELEQRMEHFDASRSASTVDYRRLEFLRWLVQHNRMSL